MRNHNLASYRHLLVEPNTPQVDIINQFTYTHYARAWAHIGFLPVLRKIKPNVYYVKLYYRLDKIRDIDVLFQFVATYYREKFRDLSEPSPA